VANNKEKEESSLLTVGQISPFKVIVLSHLSTVVVCKKRKKGKTMLLLQQRRTKIMRTA
jgi:hypothetical protein